MINDDILDKNSALYLERALRLGNAILFTGAGFSCGAKNIVGGQLPLGSELKAELWKIAFPGEPVDSSSSLGEVFDVAVRTQRSETERVLRNLLTTDRDSIPGFYETYFRVPWFRIYTLNMDDLIAAIHARFDIPHDVRTVSAVREQVPTPEALSAVHLNGDLADFPNVTFSPPQYGHRAARPDFAYGSLARDLVAHCVVFVGTQLDEPPLWQHIAMRGDRPAGHELRPKSFLVTPTLPVARAALLDRFNVRHIPLEAGEFAEKFLEPVAKDAPPRALANASPGEPYQRLDAAFKEPSESLPDFLLGREPTWADVREGFAVPRTFEEEVATAAMDADIRAVLITGTAGSGKSTTVRRLALFLQAHGRDVRWLRFDAPDSVAQLRVAGLNSKADVLVIDRAERFRERGLDLLRALAEAPDGPQVIATYSSPAFDELRVEDGMSNVNFRSFVVPLLDDEDIWRLLAALKDANRLGRLAGLLPEQQFAAFKQRADRQLLVAMLEATSGERFEEKIYTECESLSLDLQMAYAVVVLATANRYRLRVEDVLAAMSDVTSTGLEVVERLARQHLILRASDGSIVARHPVIAREALTHYRRSGQLGEALARLAFVFASKVYPGMPRTPERRILNRLTSHEYVGQLIDSRAQVRSMYEDLEPLLRDDAHYWLQRGSYELERGDLSLADNFLSQARGLAGGDYMVETEWAYLMLERACREPTAADASQLFSRGFELLLDITDRVGARTPNTYVVLAQKAVAWSRTGPLSFDDRRQLLEVVRGVMSEGAKLHAGNRHLRTAREDLESTYLRLSLE